MQQGTGAGQVEIAYGNPVKVTWHFAPVEDQTHTFVLTYKVVGIFQKASDADVLNWEALGVMALSGTASVLWSMFSTFSDEGVESSVRWRAFSRYLRVITDSKEPDIPAETFERYLSYAASFGLAERWVKYFQEQGMAVVPPWFHSLATAGADDLSYFVTMIVVTKAVGGYHGAGASGGSGAAGGGSSGAG